MFSYIESNLPDNIFMIKSGQKFDFSHDFLCQLFVVRVEANSFDGINLIQNKEFN